MAVGEIAKFLSNVCTVSFVCIFVGQLKILSPIPAACAFEEIVITDAKARAVKSVLFNMMSSLHFLRHHEDDCYLIGFLIEFEIEVLISKSAKIF